MILFAVGAYFALAYPLALSGVAGLAVFVPLVGLYILNGNLSWKVIQAEREQNRAAKAFRKSMSNA